MNIRKDTKQVSNMRMTHNKKYNGIQLLKLIDLWEMR